jgi:UDP-glucuronate 4-epimerase
MKIVVTGCAGFVGSHLTDKLLSQNHEVIGIDNFDPFYPRKVKEANMELALRNNNFTFIEGDICNVTDLDKIPEGIQMVIHLAAKAGVRPSIINPEAYIKNNILGTQTVLNWMQKRAINKMVFASSSSVYGNNIKVPFSENDAVDNPISPYAFTKKACELLNHTYHHLYNFDILNLRFFTVYGPRQRPDLAIRKFVELIDNKKPIPVYGNGTTGRDYTFVDDIVTGIILAMNYVASHEKVFEILNIGNNSPVLLNDLINHIGKALAEKVTIEYSEMQAGDVELTFADITKAKQLLGYSPTTSITKGLNKFVNWYRFANTNKPETDEDARIAGQRVISFSKKVDLPTPNIL